MGVQWQLTFFRKPVPVLCFNFSGAAAAKASTTMSTNSSSKRASIFKEGRRIRRLECLPFHNWLYLRLQFPVAGSAQSLSLNPILISESSLSLSVPSFVFMSLCLFLLLKIVSFYLANTLSVFPHPHCAQKFGKTYAKLYQYKCPIHFCT